MEPEVNELIMDSLNINYIDESEYPSTTDIQNRCRLSLHLSLPLLSYDAKSGLKLSPAHMSAAVNLHNFCM